MRINDGLLRRAKERAAHEGRTLTSMIEEGLSLVLREPRPTHEADVQLPVSKATGGVLPGVDLNRSCDLEQIMSEP